MHVLGEELIRLLLRLPDLDNAPTPSIACDVWSTNPGACRKATARCSRIASYPWAVCPGTSALTRTGISPPAVASPGPQGRCIG